jgi:hypothetical protein
MMLNVLCKVICGAVDLYTTVAQEILVIVA